MKVTLDIEISDFQEKALSSMLLQGEAVTDAFLRGFCENAVEQALRNLCDMFLRESVIMTAFKEEKE